MWDGHPGHECTHAARAAQGEPGVEAGNDRDDGQIAPASRPATLASLMIRAVLARMDLPSVSSATR
jgi:hypothetical protein